MSANLFDVQRMMRQRRGAAVRRGVVGILDVGSSRVACLILQFVPHGAADNDAALAMPKSAAFRVIGSATTRSRGVEFGEIAAMEETENAIRTVVQQAQKMAGVRVDQALVCFAGGEPRSYGVEGMTDIEDGEVTERDIGRSLAACDLPDYGEGRDVLHAMPVNFTLDNRPGLGDPRGHVGNRLSVDMHLVTVDSGAVQGILHAMRRCDLELAGISLSSYASGLSSLVEDEQELGAACIDLGGGTTGISVFLRRHMIYADSVRLGGDHVTYDICQGLQIPLQVAERLKTFHGGVVATGADDRDLIDIPDPRGEDTGERRQVSRSELIGIIRPRVEEILEDVRSRLDAAGFEHLPGQRIVLTGGGSQLPGLDVLAARILGRQTRIGRPLRIHGLPQAMTGASFSAPVGMALHTSHPQDECWDFEIPQDRRGVLRLRRAMRWFRENW
jgi:cell division protein FtsA